MQQQQQQSNFISAMEAFNKLDITERALFLGVVDDKFNRATVATKKQQRKKQSVPKEFSEEYFYSELVRTHNKSVEKRLARLHKTTGIDNSISLS